MARPKSEEKRVALLNATAKLLAERGLTATPTSKVAKLAGVAEGTLFRYFLTKEDLLNALYIHINQSMCIALSKSCPTSSSFQVKFRCLWDNYIDWGLSHPIYYQVLSQLEASSVLTEETKKQVQALFPEPEITEILSDNEVFTGFSDYADAVFGAIANTTIELSVNDLSSTKTFKERGFSVLWKIYGDG